MVADNKIDHLRVVFHCGWRVVHRDVIPFALTDFAAHIERDTTPAELVSLLINGCRLFCGLRKEFDYDPL